MKEKSIEEIEEMLKNLPENERGTLREIAYSICLLSILKERKEDDIRTASRMEKKR